MESQFSSSRGRRNYDECNISEAELVQINHRFQLIEADVANLKTSNRTNEEMLRDIHQKIMQTKSIAFGFKLGVGSLLTILVVAISVVYAFFTGKIPLSDLLKMFFS
jgi:hypothetical protein